MRLATKSWGELVVTLARGRDGGRVDFFSGGFGAHGALSGGEEGLLGSDSEGEVEDFRGERGSSPEGAACRDWLRRGCFGRHVGQPRGEAAGWEPHALEALP
jgi:hypothetical protein